MRKRVDWHKDVEIGSVMRSRNGQFRIVRNVSRYPNGDLARVSFSIKHCSWTKRCYTVYHYNDLIFAGYELVPNVYMPMTPMDAVVNRVIQSHSQELTCCDVENLS